MFYPHFYRCGALRPWEYLPADDLTFKVGDALTLSGGLLVKATGTTVPTYICMADITVSTEQDRIPVIAVDADTCYETTLAVQNTAIAVGAKYTLHTDAASITATTQGGVATVVSFEGTAAGSRVLVQF